MNLGFVVHRYDLGEGTGGYVVRLAEELCRDHDITIYAREFGSTPPAGTRAIEVPAFGGPSISTILSFPRSFEKVRLSHDVLHAQGWVAFEADVVTTHIVYGAWRATAKKHKHASSIGEMLFGSLIESQERKLLTRHAKQIIAPSQFAKYDIERLYGITENINVIPHGFAVPADLETTRTVLPAGVTRGDQVLALYAGDARKGLDPILNILAGVQNVHLLVASHSNPTRYLSAAERNMISDRVTWLGPQPNVGAWVSSVDLLVHPTIYDTFALVVAEAMAAGVPVVTSDKAGVSELIEHRQSGWIIPAGDEGALTEALNTLASDNALRERIGNSGREVARGRTWEHVAKQTLSVYERAVS